MGRVTLIGCLAGVQPVTARSAEDNPGQTNLLVFYVVLVYLELEHEGAAPGSTSQPVRRNISLKLKAKSKSASSLSSGKSKKKEGKSGEKSRTGSEGDKESKRKQKSPGTAAAAQVVVMRELKWDHQILPIGQKVQDPLLHLCEKCSLPILVYGRLSPCKHSFCLTCAEKGNGKCPRSHYVWRGVFDKLFPRSWGSRMYERTWERSKVMENQVYF
ncbi:unnamed protein product [Porites lobata]|uniref:RING-type E3 ubiquitin transferase n=1 Tax=Porites lobata TaxID=104759 RepID=A0ABN8S9K6_9CNID|nr:unnamed protein product [Porites lobata]